MSYRKQIAQLRAKMVAKMGNVVRAVQILLDAGAMAFADAVRYCLAMARSMRA